MCASQKGCFQCNMKAICSGPRCWQVLNRAHPKRKPTATGPRRRLAYVAPCSCLQESVRCWGIVQTECGQALSCSTAMHLPVLLVPPKPGLYLYTCEAQLIWSGEMDQPICHDRSLARGLRFGSALFLVAEGPFLPYAPSASGLPRNVVAHAS